MGLLSGLDCTTVHQMGLTSFEKWCSRIIRDYLEHLPALYSFRGKSFDPWPTHPLLLESTVDNCHSRHSLVLKPTFYISRLCKGSKTLLLRAKTLNPWKGEKVWKSDVGKRRIWLRCARGIHIRAGLLHASTSSFVFCCLEPTKTSEMFQENKFLFIYLWFFVYLFRFAGSTTRRRD